MLASKILSSSEVDDINTGYVDLSTIDDEESRAGIIRELVSRRTTERIVDYFQGLNFGSFEKNVMPNLTLSGAGMIKIKLFSSPNGEIRLHIFPSIGLGEAADKIGGNCHVHDFQSYSRVLSGGILEEQYSVTPLSHEFKDLFHQVIKRSKTIDLSRLTEVAKALDRLLTGNGNSSDIDLVNTTFNFIDPHELSKLFVVFDGRKSNLKDGTTVEEFHEIGNHCFNFEGMRNIEGGNSYFLPAETGHRVKTKDDTVTLFSTDTTYISQGFRKKGGLFLRGHGKHFPQLQEKIEQRSPNGYKITQQQVYKVVSSIMRQSVI